MPEVVERLHDLELDGSELTIGDNDEVAAAAGWVHESDGAESVPEFVEGVDLLLGGVAGKGGRELFTQFVEEQRVQCLEDVLLGRVVLAQCASGCGVSH